MKETKENARQPMHQIDISRHRTIYHLQLHFYDFMFCSSGATKIADWITTCVGIIILVLIDSSTHVHVKGYNFVRGKTLEFMVSEIFSVDQGRHN